MCISVSVSVCVCERGKTTSNPNYCWEIYEWNLQRHITFCIRIYSPALCRCPRTMWCLFIYARVKQFIHVDSHSPAKCICLYVCVCLHVYRLYAYGNSFIWLPISPCIWFNLVLLLLVCCFNISKVTKDLMCVCVCCMKQAPYQAYGEN